MGRVETYDYSPIMSASDVARYLLDTCQTLSFFESFMFGSSLLGVGSDYDILIVGPSGELLLQVKAELKLAGAELPLDILCMLPIEASETCFVANQKCISLQKLAHFGS
jgi:hypothetical protein